MIFLIKKSKIGNALVTRYSLVCSGGPALIAYHQVLRVRVHLHLYPIKK